MFQRILVPLDGTPEAECAVGVAARLARSSRGNIAFVRVVPPPLRVGSYGMEPALALPPDAFERDITEAEKYLVEMKHTYANDLRNIPFELEIDTGSTSPTICSVAKERAADLIILSNHRTHGLFHWTIGSITHEAVRHSPSPLLLLNDACGTFLEKRQEQAVRILVPLDGSSFSEAVLEPVRNLVFGLGATTQIELHLLRIIDLPSVDGKSLSRAYQIRDQQEEARREAEEYLQQIAHQFTEHMPEEYRLTITWSTPIETHVARTILELTDPTTEIKASAGYDLIAMATHGRGGFQRFILGSVTEQVLDTTRLPLLIVRPAQPVNSQQKHATGAQVTVINQA